MKCDYCGGEDHLVSACRQKTGDRSLEFGGGCLLVGLLAPFALIGIILGALSGAFMAGFRYSRGAWTVAKIKMRGRRDESPSV